MCGIFAWAGKSINTFDKAKFDLLGIYNNSRGGDSCGVTTDGEIYYGLNTSKHYHEFIINSGYLKPEVVPVVFGHTRKSSVGGINGSNAHPFGFGTHKQGYEFIGVHNGTLLNHKEIADKFDIEETLYKENGQFGTKIFDRTKIDSEIFLEALYKSKSYKVINEYNGGAAIIFQDLKHPNILYAYHGASKLISTDANDKIYEERPLYYYRQNKHNIYISSLYEPLEVIGGKLNETVHEFECNTVYVIKDGNIDFAQKIKIARTGCYQKKGIDYGFPSYGKPASQSYVDIYNKKHTPKPKVSHFIEDIENIYNEPIKHYFKSSIYMQKLRYWRNGHLINGIYTYVKNYGFLFLTINSKVYEEAALKLLHKVFDLEKGQFIEDKQVVLGNTNQFIPFINENVIPILFFKEGILLETEYDYDAIDQKYKVFSFNDLSFMSKHPIIDVSYTYRADDQQNIILNGKVFDGKISPLQSGRVYDIIDGELYSIRETIKDTIELPPLEGVTPVIPLNVSYPLKDDKQTEIFLDEYSLRNTDVPLTTDSNDEVIRKVDEILMPIYESIQEANKELNALIATTDTEDYINEIIETNEFYLLSMEETLKSV
jgi:predicted glutamine amidotransferase